jgi:hypothetical protein
MGYINKPDGEIRKNVKQIIETMVKNRVGRFYNTKG